MQHEPPEQKKHRQWVMTCVGVSVVLGLIVGQMVDTEELDKLKLISLTGGGAIEDIVLVVAAILLVVGGARLTVILPPVALVCVGILLLLATFAGPSLIARISSKPQISIPFVPASVLEFVGAALLGAGLRPLIFPSDHKTKAGREGSKSE